MHFRLIAFVGLAGLLFGSPAAVAAEAGCCREQERCCTKADTAAPCCTHHSITPDPTPADILLAMAQPSAATIAPARQSIEVRFNRPVMVGKQILQGRYVIEHDNDRMARGEPCTHVYAFHHRQAPVVAFHCTHLDRKTAKENSVVLASTGEVMQTFVEFQFAGESAAHGFPTAR